MHVHRGLPRSPRCIKAPAFRFRTLCVTASFAALAAAAVAQGITPDQLQMLQQAQQGRSSGTSQTVAPGVTPQNTILEPTGVPSQQPISRLEQILSDRAGISLQLFGYDQLGSSRPVNLPQIGAVQDSYILGAGDEVVVSLRGQENSEYRAMVDRDGRVVLPKLNPISAAGRTFGQFRQDVAAAISRAYVSTQGFVSIGRIRQISVLVSGEVGSPGMRTLTGLSTVVDAVLVSGGIKKSGSLRNVKIVRGGREITIDLYAVLTGQARSNAATLTDGDRIIIPTLGKTVAVSGWVRKPGIYELPAGRSAISARQFMALAGGTETRGLYRMTLLHVGSDGRNQMSQLSDAGGTVSDGDILFVQPAASENSRMVTLSGGTNLAGKYAATGGKLSQLLKSPGALGEEPYTLFGVISRRDPNTKLRTLMPFTPVAVLNGIEDMTIQSDDIIRVLSTTEARSLLAAVQQFRARRTAEQEATINPQSAEQALGGKSMLTAGTNNINGINGGNGANGATGANAMDAGVGGEFSALKSGGVPQAGSSSSAGASSSNVGDVLSSASLGQNPDMAGVGQRQILGTLNASGISGSAAGDGTDNGIAGPAGGRGSPQPGNLNQSQPQLQSKSVRLSDLAVQLRVDDLVLVNFLDDRAINIDGAVNGPGLYFIGPDANINAVLAAAGGLSRQADRTNIDVISTILDTATGSSQTEHRKLTLAGGANESYIVGPRDDIRVNEVFSLAGGGSVALAGQVRHAGTYHIVRGEHLSDLLIRAGGLTDTAYPYGTVFLRRSVALKEQDAYHRQAEEIQNQLILAMSRRDPTSKMSPDSYAAIQSYISQVRNQKPIGRVTVVADPAILAANPGADPLLEPNDVVYVPQRPYSVSVLGEVLQPGSIPFRSDMSATDYIDAAGGYSQFANSDQTILVLPDGSARRVQNSWLKFSSDVVPPGSTIFVARDVSGLDTHQIFLDITQITSQLAVSVASLAVLATQVK